MRSLVNTHNMGHCWYACQAKLTLNAMIRFFIRSLPLPMIVDAIDFRQIVIAIATARKIYCTHMCTSNYQTVYAYTFIRHI